MTRDLKFPIQEVEGLYYLCSENKGADQLCGYRKADLRLCFLIMQLICITLSKQQISKALIILHRVPGLYAPVLFAYAKGSFCHYQKKLLMLYKQMSHDCNLHWH